jgi:DNA (cytosine-5)-methyltransferase 1
MALDSICADLETENYATETFILPACGANAPHRRERVWIVAHLNCMRLEGCISHWHSGQIHENINRDLAKIITEWQEFIPHAWKAHTAREWLQINADILREDHGISRKVDRIAALGNAIVPQVVYPIMKLIHEIEREQS